MTLGPAFNLVSGLAQRLFKANGLPFPKTSPYEREIKLLNATGGSHGMKVSFFNEDDLLVLNGVGGQNMRAQKGRIDGDIIELSTDKDLDNPTGTWTITLHDRPIQQQGSMTGKRLIDVIKAMDLVVITGRRDTVQGGLMVGVVGQKPSESEGAVENYTVPTITVTGYDLGKLLSNAQIFYFNDVPLAGIKEFALKGWAYLSEGNFPAGTRASFAKLVFEQILYKMTRINYKTRIIDLPNLPSQLSGPVASILDNLPLNGLSGPSLEPMEEGSVPKLFGYHLGKTYGQLPPMGFFEHEQTLWAFMESVAEKPFTEVFVDTIPDDADYLKAMLRDVEASNMGEIESLDENQAKVAFFLRETPFSKEDWNNLPLFQIDPSVIKGSPTVGGEPTLYNVFYATPVDYGAQSAQAMKAITGAVFLVDSFLKHGYRPLNAQTKAINMNDGDLGRIQQVIADLTNRLLVWFGLSDEFLSGSIPVQGNPLYRVGTRLRRVYGQGRNLARDFYLEGVSHSWQAFGDWTTTLRVTRGLDSMTDLNREARFTPVAPLMEVSDFLNPNPIGLDNLYPGGGG